MDVISRTRNALSGESARGNLDHFDPYWAAAQSMGQGMYGMGGMVQTLGGQPAETVPADFAGLAQGGHRGNGVIFSCMLSRQSAFSTIRFQYQQLLDGRPSKMFGDRSLRLLETPWPGGTTQDLLARVISDADLAGNSFHMVETSMATLGGDGGEELVRLRPDWVSIAMQPRGSGLGYRKIGFVYTEGGLNSGEREVPLLLEEVAHFMPTPDPLANFRGVSWLTPIIREIQSDAQMNIHKQAFFENGATPNMIVKHPAGASPDSIRRFRDMLDANHQGAGNAYKRLHLYPGADATTVGVDFKQLEFAVTQGHGETRICMAAGVPPIIVGSSEGLASATYSNYGQARRRFADLTVHPLWQNVAGSLQVLMPRQQEGTRLWYDTRDVPLLREDEKDAAEIRQLEASTMRSLIDAGYEPDSVKQAMLADDFGLLVHSGLYSVQLQKPGSADGPAAIDPPTSTLKVAGGSQ